MKKYEIIDISGDVGIRVFGKEYRELFVNSAEGLYSLITDIEKVQPKIKTTIELHSDSIESLLVNYLNELIFYFDAYGFIGKQVTIDELAGLKIKAIIVGDYFDSQIHSSGLLVKAATYHNLKVYQEGEIKIAEIIFDI